MQPEKTMQIRVTENGPYLVSGSVPIARQTIVADGDGNSIGWREGQSYETKESCALCRCGQSANKPFCDGSHVRVGFQGTESASREPYVRQADIQEGPSLLLTDAVPLCAFARFCDVAGQVWNLVEQARSGSRHQDRGRSRALSVRAPGGMGPRDEGTRAPFPADRSALWRIRRRVWPVRSGCGRDPRRRGRR